MPVEQQTDLTVPQADVIALILAERQYQDAKWGDLGHHPHPLGEWLLVLDGKLREAITLWQQSKGDDATLAKVTYLAAAAVACLECVGRPMVDEWIRGMEFQRTNCGYMSPNERAKRWYPVLEAIQARREQERQT